MKRIELVFAAVLVPLDYVVLLLAGWTAYNLRFHQVTSFLPVVNTIPAGTFMKIAALVAVGWIGVLALAGVFAVRQPRLSRELGRIFLGASTAVLLIIVFIFFRREFFASRFIIVASWVLAVVFLWITHALVRGIQRLLLRQGIGARQIVVIGNDANSAELTAAFRHRADSGYRVLRQFPLVSLETLTQLKELLSQGNVDEVLQADPNTSRPQSLQLLELCTEHGVVFKYAADVFDTQVGRIMTSDFAGVPLIEIRRTPLDGWGRIIKRTVDVVGATLGIVVLAIPSAVVAAIVKVDSAGPVFARLERVGQGQRRFRLWKFRSMIRDAEALKPQLASQNERADGPLFKMANDPRITRVGKWLRKTSIDEFPQLLNVWRGDMSLVGPRPHEPAEVARYEQPHKKLLTVRPGMTGMAQVSGRSNLSFDEEARLDTYYIEHWSLGLDLQILLRTPMAIFHTETAA